jgi:Fe-S-cluster-containing dehydrogenase component
MKRLLIDLEHCASCPGCGQSCSYVYHPGNLGITALREFAHFAVVCRRCDDEPCVASCPWEALEKQGDRVLKRYLMRCTSCKSCSHGCPFGTIYPETIPFIAGRCDYCLERLEKDKLPVCATSCAHGGIQYGDFEENKDENIYKVSEHLLVKSAYEWQRALPEKKKK